MNTNMDTEIHVQRLPKPIYDGQNGFLGNPTENHQINPSNIQQALSQHRRALFVVDHKKRPIPDFEELQAEDTVETDLQFVENRIRTMNKEHLEDLAKMYTIHAEEYKLEAYDRYLSKDETGEINAGPSATEYDSRMQELYGDGTKDYSMELDWQNDYEQIRYAHLSQIIILQEEKRKLKLREEDARRLQEQMFPATTAEFNSKGKDVQLRVARFLIGDDKGQERMVNEFGWAWRQVMPLKTEFAKNGEFSSNIRAMMISEQSVRDPRKRV